MKIYVDINAIPNGNGSKEHPYRKINEAAAVAEAGDEVIVAPGIYREDVNPIYGGMKTAPIVYKSEKSRAAVITGADVFKGWEHYEGDVWKLTIDNGYFGDYNPYTTFVYGDWLDISIHAHTGDVFLNEVTL